MPLAVLEVGGTHATAVLVDPVGWAVRPGPAGRVALRGGAAADELLDGLASCVRSLGPLAGATLAVAIPGPFDYASGIGRFRGVGKFSALCGVDVRKALAARLSPPPRRLVFVNDAAAFGLGEWVAGAARGSHRAVAITLGTGIGSAFVADGVLVTDGPRVPPEGYVYRLSVDGRPLESVVSRRAILARYRAAGGDRRLDVRDIAELAAAGDHRARESFTRPLAILGTVLAPWLVRFDAELLVVGGAMSGSWPLVAPALRAGLRAADPGAQIRVRKARDPDAATAVGAAWHAVHEVEPTPPPTHVRGGTP